MQLKATPSGKLVSGPRLHQIAQILKLFIIHYIKLSITYWMAEVSILFIYFIY